MKYIIMLLIALFTSNLIAADEAAPVLDAAQKAKKSVAIFFEGPDYQRAGKKFKHDVWQKANFYQKASEHYLLYAVEDKSPPADKKKKDTSLNQFKQEIQSWPALVIVDNEGRICGRKNNIALATDMNVSNTLHYMDQVNRAISRRDFLFAQAETQSGADKATSLAQGLLAIEPLVPGKLFRRDYQPVLEAIKAADPNDESGYVRRFNYNLKGFKESVNKAIKAKDFDGADSLIRAELSHPKNNVLSPGQKQEICLAAHNAYKQDKSRPEMQWKMLELGAKYGPETHLGLGMRGTLAYSGRGDVAIPYGWFPKDVKNGKFSWDITMGCQKAFDHAGDYTVVFAQNKGKGTFKIHSPVLTVDGVKYMPVQPLGEVTGKGEITFDFKITMPVADNAKIVLTVDGECTDPADSHGSINVRNVLNIE